MAGLHFFKRLGYFSLAIGLAFHGPALAAQPQNGSPEKPAAAVTKMEGEWKAAAATHAGIELGGPFLTNMTLKIKGDQFDLQAGPLKEKGKVDITAESKPVKLKLTATDGNNKGKTLLAICEQSGPDQLKICYTLKGKEYPKAFESTEDTKALLVTYERAK